MDSMSWKICEACSCGRIIQNSNNKYLAEYENNIENLRSNRRQYGLAIFWKKFG